MSSALSDGRAWHESERQLHQRSSRPREGAACGNGNDIIQGNDYDNPIRGDGGNDILTGGAGLDFLRGDQGDDIISATAKPTRSTAAAATIPCAGVRASTI